MVKRLEPEQNHIENEDGENEDDGEEVICTHYYVEDQTDSSSQQQYQEPKRPTPARNDGDDLNGKDVATAAVAAGTAGVAVPVAATAGLSAVGFGSGGIVGGSIAAGVQAGIGNVVAGSTFATLQSIGATGGFAILGPVGLVSAALFGVTTLGIMKWRKSRRTEQQEHQATEEDMSKKKLGDDYDRPGGCDNLVERRPYRRMCLECRKKYLLRITRELCHQVNL